MNLTKQQKMGLGVAGVAGGGLLLYRKMQAAKAGPAATAVTNSSATGSITPYTPQSPVLVPQGESIYDPNSESLLNTPATSAAVPQSTSPAAPAYTVNVNYPTPAATKPKAKAAPKKKVTHTTAATKRTKGTKAKA